MQNILSNVLTIIESSHDFGECLRTLNISMNSSFNLFYKILYELIKNTSIQSDQCHLEKLISYLDISFSKADFNLKKKYKGELQSLKNLIIKKKNYIKVENKEDYQKFLQDIDNMLIETKKEVNKTIETKKTDDMIGILINGVRREVVHDEVIIIDDPDTKLHDDGLSIKKLPNNHLLIGIHLIDPLAYYPYDLITSDAEHFRSIIVGEKIRLVRHPEVKDLNLLSLKYGEERLAKSFYFEIDKHGNCISYDFKNTIVTVSKQYNYQEFNERYKERDPGLFPYRNALILVKRILGDVDFYENTIMHNASNNIESISDFSHSLISHLSLYTGFMCARHFSINRLPFVYHCYRYKNNDTTLTEKQNIPFWGKSFVSRFNLGHEDKKLPYLSGITSPSRQAASWMNFHVMDTCLFKNATIEELEVLKSDIDYLCNLINFGNQFSLPKLNEKTLIY